MPRRNHQKLRRPHNIHEVYPMNIERRELRDLLLSVVETNHWNKALSEREQVVYVHQYCKNSGIYASQYELAKFFGVERTTIQYHLLQGIDEINPSIERPLGRPSILNENEKTILKQFIIYHYENKYPVTYQGICEFCFEKFQKDIMLDTIRHIIGALDDKKFVTGIPMDNDRALCDIAKLDLIHAVCVRFFNNQDNTYNTDTAKKRINILI